MTMDNRKKHDEVTKIFLAQDIGIAKDFLKIYLPTEILTKCNLDTVAVENTSYIEEDLRTNYSDIVYKLDIQDDKYNNCAYIYVIVEHQSTADRLMPFRVMCYQIAIIKKHLENNNYKKSIVKLPLVIPLVFYNGKRSPYPYACDINESFADKNLYQKIPLGTFKLIDLTVKTDSELLKHGKLAMLEVVEKHINMREFAIDIMAIAKSFAVGYENLISETLVNATLSYLYQALEAKELQVLIAEIVKQVPYYKENTMSYAEELRKEGKIAMVKDLIRYGVDDKIIMKTAKLTKKQLEELKKSIH
jgi:predicted transposase/invertase (TIGR01784 family)